MTWRRAVVASLALGVCLAAFAAYDLAGMPGEVLATITGLCMVAFSVVVGTAPACREQPRVLESQPVAAVLRQRADERRERARHA